MALQDANVSIYRETSIKENLDFILSHLSNPLFPRTIMTRALGHQKEVLNPEEVLTHFKASNYQDFRINAYPSYTDYHGINLTAPSFIMIDLDLKDFESHEKLDKILHRTLNNINEVLHGSQPTVLWTGGGYHIYQPIKGLILEQIDRFACYSDPSKKDLTSRFMQFAEDYFTDKKSDPQHRPSIKSCLIRIPGTINSKYNQEVRIIQRWDGTRPTIQYLLREYRTWLVAEKINNKLEEKRTWKHRNMKNIDYSRTGTISWIDKLLGTPVADHRKYVIWRILMPYLSNIKNLSDTEVITVIQTWLDKCNELRSLDFNADYLIKQNIRNSKKQRFLPISFNNLLSENRTLYDIISRSN
jgi:hypothetical protein